MRHPIGALALVLTLTLQACLSSSLVLQVAPDGHGRAIITSRLYERQFRAFQELLAIAPSELKSAEDSLTPPTDQQLAALLGGPVKIEDTTLENTADGVVRTTVVSFADVTRLRLTFPPVLSVPGHAEFGAGTTESPVMTFSMRPHENGDRLLLVHMPETRMEGESQPHPPEPRNLRLEHKIKEAAKGMRVAFAVALDMPLLRTNAPAPDGNRATILDIDVEGMIAGLSDEKMAHLAAAPTSVQELLWTIGDVGGGVTPADREIFLEFESPAAPPAAAAPQTTRPDTEIYLAPLTITDTRIDVGAPVNITNNPGYDNQPFFTPDGRAILFTSVRGGGTQTDIYRYDLAGATLSQVTRTPESEYSPTITPSGDLSVVRVELDPDATQRLWRFTSDGREPRLVLATVKPVGYHAWSDDHTVALYVLGRPATLQVADTRAGTTRVVATNIARSLQPVPGGHTISFVQRDGVGADAALTINELNPVTGDVRTLTRALPGGDEADVAWTPDGTLLMARGEVLYAWRRGEAAWRPVAALDRLGLRRVSRLAVNPAGDRIAFVAQP